MKKYGLQPASHNRKDLIEFVAKHYRKGKDYLFAIVREVKMEPFEAHKHNEEVITPLLDVLIKDGADPNLLREVRGKIIMRAGTHGYGSVLHEVEDIVDGGAKNHVTRTY